MKLTWATGITLDPLQLVIKSRFFSSQSAELRLFFWLQCCLKTLDLSPPDALLISHSLLLLLLLLLLAGNPRLLLRNRLDLCLYLGDLMLKLNPGYGLSCLHKVIVSHSADRVI